MLGVIDSYNLPIELREVDERNYKSVALANLRFSFIYTGFPGNNKITGSVSKILVLENNLIILHGYIYCNEIKKLFYLGWPP